MSERKIDALDEIWVCTKCKYKTPVAGVRDTVAICPDCGGQMRKIVVLGGSVKW